MKHMMITELIANGMEIRTKIRKDTRIELALKGLRYYDILRWKEGDFLAADQKGMKKSFALSQANVASIPVDDNGYIIFSTRNTFKSLSNYLVPVPFLELQKNPKSGQNIVW